MRDSLILYVNGRRHEVRGRDAFGPLSSWLRYTLGLTGTKVVCAEGDCGSCAVLIGRVVDGAIRYRPVTSCIQYLYQLDATHIVTVEGLTPGGPDTPDGLSPVQEAMVACHGAQCGFCTPGFVVSMSALLEENRRPSETEVRRALVGNLCRCTGYAPILDAARAIDAGRFQSVHERYADPTLLADLRATAESPVCITAGERRFCKPVTLIDAIAWRGENPGCTIIAGGTDLGVTMNKGRADPQAILSTVGLAELRTIHVADGRMEVGAGATLAEWQAACRGLLPAAEAMLERHGSPLIRNAGTLAGNIVNGSPIGDSMPLLFVLDAEVELAGPTATRRVRLDQFYTGYRQSVLQPDELLTRVIIPLPPADAIVRFYKVSRREDLDISTFAAAIRIELDGDTIRTTRLALGGVAATIQRMVLVERFLEGRPFTLETFLEAGEMAARQVRPLSDVRGAAAYRTRLAANVLVRFYMEASGAAVPPVDGDGRFAPVSVNGEQRAN